MTALSGWDLILVTGFVIFIVAALALSLHMWRHRQGSAALLSMAVAMFVFAMGLWYFTS
ncbi:MAG: hypothetical protein ACTHQE_02375 [Thermomicrobiales bacterium]